VTLSGEHGALHVRGRADGYDPGRQLVEEVKTYRGQLSSLPDNHRHLHWAQLRVYGHLMCEKEGLAQIHLALVYFDIGSQQETVLEETRSREELPRCSPGNASVMRWAEQELAHRAARDTALQSLRFPHGDFRPGQRQLAEAVFRAHSGRRSLLAQAPTGIGKTLGTLFPALKAARRSSWTRSSSWPPRPPAANWRSTPPPPSRRRENCRCALLEPVPATRLASIRIVCRGDSCPLAQGFYDRLPAARAACFHAAAAPRTLGAAWPCSTRPALTWAAR
jgi:hypothetical protein